MDLKTKKSEKFPDRVFTASHAAPTDSGGAIFPYNARAIEFNGDFAGCDQLAQLPDSIHIQRS